MAETPAVEVSPPECRRRAARHAELHDLPAAGIWALLAIAGELAELRRELRRSR